MKPVTTIFAAVFISILISTGVVWIAVNSDEDQSRLEDQAVLSSRLAQTQERLLDIQGDLDEMRNRWRENLAESAALRAGSTVSAAEFESMKEEIARLQARLEARELPAALLAAGKDPSAVNEVETLLGKQIKAAVDEGMKERRKQEFRRWTPMVKAGFKRGLTRTAKRLELDENQTKRLEASVDKALENVMPQIGVMMDPNASATDRDSAFAEVEGSMQGVGDEAASYMNSQQLEDFSTWQNQSLEGMNRFRTVLGGGIPGPGAPASGSNPRDL